MQQCQPTKQTRQDLVSVTSCNKHMTHGHVDNAMQVSDTPVALQQCEQFDQMHSKLCAHCMRHALQMKHL